jgi:hypothetical protein
MGMQDYTTHFDVYACLPFVELAGESHIKIGPIIFWPASKFKQFVPKESHSLFHDYIDSITQVKTRVAEKTNPINTVKLAPQVTTMISINGSIPEELKELLLIDSLYLLYFACTFRDLYYGNEIPPFGAFKKMLPASHAFIVDKPNWKGLHINEIDREQTVCVHLHNQQLCKCFGEMLSSVFDDVSSELPKTIEVYKRIIRSVRYVVDRFSDRFVNLFNKGLNFPEIAFEAEDVIFIAAGFECLFDIEEHRSAFDFKHKLRALLHLKYSTPLEIFWKWVDDFYNVRRKIVHEGQIVDPTFYGNPNFEVSHVMLGIKLFIYSIYSHLFNMHLLKSKAFNEQTPPDFKFIHPEEILLFFWTETSLLKKIRLFLFQIMKRQEDSLKLYPDIRFLVHLFMSMHQRHDRIHPLPGIRFLPSKTADIQSDGQEILRLIEMAKESHEKYGSVLKEIPQQFVTLLNKRLSTKKAQRPLR